VKVVNRLKTKPIKFGLDIDQSESVAIAAFTFLAAEPEYFSRFAGVTGVDLGDIAEIAGSREFLTAVLTYMLSDESLLLAFCENNDQQPEIVNTAHMVLGGRDAFN